ncbi:hypothetical protein QRX50_23240 [Amycolatopsis carbonis]|uniref:Uncharacterized protein n=1 Tax=Amycolatopsis carbonis TaxID=715471 RepID=A0A9Y2IQB2_9PSEU|nr:hypothetical protein [Amycolatopsis sp. 2-15]WIX83461.1 hypothetical protein QRX50_23240 [Amycolatopsis sp. 2-15]
MFTSAFVRALGREASAPKSRRPARSASSSPSSTKSPSCAPARTISGKRSARLLTWRDCSNPSSANKTAPHPSSLAS